MHRQLVMLLATMLLLASFTSAIEESSDLIFGSEQLVLRVNISSSLEINKTGDEFNVTNISINLTLFPRQGVSQSAIRTASSPEPSERDGSLLFSWQNPPAGTLSFSISSEVITTRNAVHVYKKEPFPLPQVPKDIQKYLAPSENVDAFDADIVALASELASGENDQFVVVYKMAEWANKNIEYNLSTLTADVSRPASWVLQYRQGVCDELTNLFIAMNRAVGIPARFVSGISYTDSPLFAERWGLHGWAEVYFPNVGWVPFDVTYGQYGFVDPGHIALLDSVDVADTSTAYSWRGRDLEVRSRSLETDVQVLDASGKLTPDISLSSRVLKSDVGFGSYTIEEVYVKNNRDYYVSVRLRHARTTRLESIDGLERDVLLLPGEEKREYFVFKVDSKLDEGFRYTFPLSVTAYLASANSSIVATERNPVFSQKEVEALKVTEQKHTIESRDVTLSCSSDKDELYTYESASITCTARNRGNTVLENIRFCENSCETFALGIAKSKEFIITKQFASPGTNRVQFNIQGNDISTTGIVDVEVNDEPSVVFDSIKIPDSIGYNDIVEITFTVEKASASMPQDVVIIIQPTPVEFTLDRLEATQPLSAQFRAINLDSGPNMLVIAAEFRDGNGRVYTEQKEITVNVQDTNVVQGIMRFFVRLFT